MSATTKTAVGTKHELGHVSQFETFAVVSEEKVIVSRWYGYDIEGTQTMTREAARRRYAYLLSEGYVPTRSGFCSENGDWKRKE